MIFYRLFKLAVHWPIWYVSWIIFHCLIPQDSYYYKQNWSNVTRKSGGWKVYLLLWLLLHGSKSKGYQRSIPVGSIKFNFYSIVFCLLELTLETKSHNFYSVLLKVIVKKNLVCINRAKMYLLFFNLVITLPYIMFLHINT